MKDNETTHQSRDCSYSSSLASKGLSTAQHEVMVCFIHPD